jgi:hypothetical protein
MHGIHIGGESSEFIELIVDRREHPDATDYWDGNWLSCDVTIAAGSFRGTVRGSLRSEDFRSLLEQIARLHERLSGSAEVRAMEEWLVLTLRGDGKGHIEAGGRVCDNVADGNSLCFRFVLDQSFLPAVIQQLTEACRAFPVVG